MTQTIENFHTERASAIATRKAYELAKNADNANMQATLATIDKSLSHDAIATILLACNYDVATIAKQERASNMRNVYSIEKDVNIARFLASVSSLNHYTLAIIKAAHALESNQSALTHADAMSACSLDCKVKDAKREKIIAAHKYQKHVAQSTSATQSSSSINALQALNVLVETRDTANVTCYTLNRDSEALKRIAAKINITL